MLGESRFDQCVATGAGMELSEAVPCARGRDAATGSGHLAVVLRRGWRDPSLISDPELPRRSIGLPICKDERPFRRRVESHPRKVHQVMCRSSVLAAPGLRLRSYCSMWIPTKSIVSSVASSPNTTK